MAIRTISYSVKSDGISPNTEQQAGLQSEHAVTQLVFTLDSTLYQALLSEKGETDTLVYRFDCCDSMGGAVKTEPSVLTSDTVSFTVGENLTRSGGKARVYLVISRYNAEEKTETELLSFPAKLRFENVPETDSDNGNSRESLSTLTEAAKNAATRAEQSADTAVEAQGKTEAARLAIEGGSTVIFDGNGTFGGMDVDFVVDTVLSKASDNAIANKAVAAKFEDIETNMTEAVENTNAELGNRELLSNKVNSFSEYVSEDDAKVQYPSIQCLKDIVHIVESGTDGIWNYRKWSDGTAECWGRSSISGISTISARGTYYYNSEVTVNYPSGFFSSKPVTNIILSPSTGFAFPSDTTSSGSKDFAQFFIVTPNEGTSDITVYYSIHAIGRWK